jgi:hypothetical protein
LGNPGESFVAIVNDQIVSIEDLDDDFRGFDRAIELRHPEAIAEHFDSLFCSSHIRLHSWTGTAGREVKQADPVAVTA